MDNEKIFLLVEIQVLTVIIFSRAINQKNAIKIKTRFQFSFRITKSIVTISNYNTNKLLPLSYVVDRQKNIYFQ